ncbi:MAG TPA: CcmD family protein [Solibacterales bacterium]|nr:CcmD family protein [Bryobacterales bacterium]
MIEARNFWFMFFGFAAAWLILGGYIFYLVRREAKIEKSLESLKALIGHREHRA